MSIEGRLKLAGIHPDVRAAAQWALAWADYFNVPIAVTSGIRSWDEQNRLYQRHLECVRLGLSGSPGACRYPANPPGDSSHQYGLSFDSKTEPRFQPWWDEVRRLAGFEVPISDPIHAQVPNWRQYTT